MSPVIMATDSRQKMIETAAVVMRERGVEATSFSEVLARSGAPRGSIYHHFPGGKAQLIEEATRYAGAFTAAGLVKALEQDDPLEAVRTFTAFWRKLLRRSDYAAGCPVVAASLEGERSPGAREAAASAFSNWEKLLAEALEARGVEAKRARSLGTLVVTSIEGAVVVSRATRSPAPLERVAAELERLLVDALEVTEPSRPRP
jgi:TetR/AcrR family transcriptional regulator, lmrAB and yxaGH operons repressor